MVEKSKKSKRLKIGLNLFSVLSGEVEIQETVDGDNYVRYGDKIAIRVCNGGYWQTNINNNNIVLGEGKKIGEWELYKIVLSKDEFVSNKGQIVQYGDNISLVSLINNQFVSANQNNRGELTARVHKVDSWEIFLLVCPPNKKQPIDRKMRFGCWFALRSSNGNYVQFDRDNSRQVMASIDWIKEWESFVIINPLDLA